ncbi:MAG: lipoyl synthase [Candidatus Omnitrophota bacterium]
MDMHRKPAWLNKKINLVNCQKVKELLRDLNLNTVCQQAACPNIGECFSRGEATFLILGKICTRNCQFCGIEKGLPAAVDWDEPLRVAQAVQKMDLKHVVLTSVTRDDLEDGGADVFIRTIAEIRKLNKKINSVRDVSLIRTENSIKLSSELESKVSSNRINIELLVPDFQLNKQTIKKLADAQPEIIAHNIETVPRLYPYARQSADYKHSLQVLKIIKESNESVRTKSGIMLGLGEEEQEVLDVFDDLAEHGCDFLSIGQYLAPSSSHVKVKEYISPEKFSYYKHKALEAGLSHVESGPYVRSSYSAASYLSK